MFILTILAPKWLTLDKTHFRIYNPSLYCSIDLKHVFWYFEFVHQNCQCHFRNHNNQSLSLSSIAHEILSQAFLTRPNIIAKLMFHFISINNQNSTVLYSQFAIWWVKKMKGKWVERGNFHFYVGITASV